MSILVMFLWEKERDNSARQTMYCRHAYMLGSQRVVCVLDAEIPNPGVDLNWYPSNPSWLSKEDTAFFASSSYTRIGAS